MNILVTIKQAGKRRNRITTLPFPLENTPCTLRALICEAVCTCVAQYNDRALRGASCTPLSDSLFDAMSETGKFTFGISTPSKQADKNEAVKTAIQGFEDGLFRIFLFDRELTALDEPLILHENDQLTFIRLTMLTGGFF